MTCACDEQAKCRYGGLACQGGREQRRPGCTDDHLSFHPRYFETEIVEICRIIHDCGAQVYYGRCKHECAGGLDEPPGYRRRRLPSELAQDLCFTSWRWWSGVGPICVAEHLVPFLPDIRCFSNPVNTVSAAPFGSAGILPITYGYIRMMGTEGLTRATKNRYSQR